MISDERLAKLRGHTPGPWRVGTHGGDVVCNTPIPEVGGADSIEYYGGHLVSESSTKANARLIAAAPDLLDTIAELKGEMRGDDRPTGVVHKSYHKAVVEKLTRERAKLKAENAKLRSRSAAKRKMISDLIDEVMTLRRQAEGRQAQPEYLSQALNEGDGTYQP